MSSVVIVDYGVGNLRSVSHAFSHAGGEVTISSDAKVIASADRLLLPGVGAFGSCMDELKSRGLVEPVLKHAQSGRPFMGICVGMQILHTVGEEFGEHQGLGLIPGRVSKIAAPDKELVLPYIGWASLEKPAGSDWAGTVLEPVMQGAYVYCLHSFMAQPENTSHILAQYHYEGVAVTAAVRKDNITGLQFHPEKSADVGLAIIRQFLRD